MKIEGRRKYEVLFYFVRSYRWLYIVIFLLSIVHGLFSSINIALFAPVLSSYINPSSDANNGWLLSSLHKFINILPFEDKIISALLLILAFAIAKCVLTICHDYMVGYGGAKILSDVKNKIMNKYASAPYKFFLDQKQGELYYTLYAAPNKVFTFLTMFPKLLMAFFNIIFFLILLMGISFRMTSFVIIILVAFHIFIGRLSRYVSYPLGKKTKQILTQQQVVGNEFINGFKQITVFLAKRKWVEEFEKLNEKFRRFSVKLAVWVSVPRNLMEMVMFFFVAIGAIYLRTTDPNFFISNFTSIAIYIVSLQMLLLNVSQTSRLRMIIMNVLPDVEACYRTLTLELKGIKQVEDGNVELKDFEREIRFDNVSFLYEERGREKLLSDINFTIEKGKTVGLVGVSGSGRTTIINLMLRLFQPTRGRILIDGIDLREYKINFWLDKIGLVSQDTFMFHSSIKDNICFGTNRYSMSEVIEAAKMANAHQFISEFPEGYDTIVGEKGMKLSGGQQQRIAIARAIIKKRSIVIFDEATSSLDNISEKAIQNAIDTLSGNHTILIIAHRLSTIQNADNIIVLREGKVWEQGTHRELLENKGYYWHLYNML